MRYTICTVILLILYLKTGFSRDGLPEHLQLQVLKAIDLQKQFKPKQALAILDGVLIATKSTSSTDQQSKSIGELYFHIASCKLDLASYNEAKQLLNRALDIFQSQDTVSIEIADTYMLLGIYYDYMAQYDKALAYYNLTKEQYSKLFPPNHFRFGYLYNNIGICIFFKGDIERALAFFNKSLAITVENFGDSDSEIVKGLNNISFCHTAHKKKFPSKKTITLALEIANKNRLIDSPRGANTFHSLSLVYFQAEDFNNALNYIQTAYTIRKKHLPEQHDEIASTYFMLASIYVETNQTELAKKFFHKALSIYKNIFGEKHPEVALVYVQLAALDLKASNLSLAQKNISQALTILNYDGNIPVSEKDKFDLNILEALDIKAQIHYRFWQDTKNIIQLKKAYRAYQDLIFLLNNFRKGFKEELSKEILAGDFFHIFNSAIETSFDLYEATQQQKYLQSAFENCEYSTSFVLLEERKNAGAKKIAIIPDSLLNIEQQLKISITELEKKKREEELKEVITPNKIVELSGKIFDLKEQLYQLIQFFEDEYPRYYKFKYDVSIVDIKTIQNQVLDNDQILVEYFIGTSNIFVFIVSQDSFFVKKIEKKFPLELWVKTLRDKITKFQYPFNLEDQYHENLVRYAEALYWEIVHPVEKYFKKRVIIIPVGTLAEIPFECFIKQTGSANHHYKEHHYLANDYALSYCYSATMLSEMVHNRKPNSKDNTIAFAPIFESVGQTNNLRDLLLLPLNFNITEVEDIASIMGAQKITGSEATKATFIEQSPDYDIIHFATHALANKINGEFSFLAFSEIKDSIENELLFVKDIYNIEFPAQMITLSACQTSIGENRKGEGIISLARSFSFNGTCNINTSLWNVNDAKTAQLMKFFYKNIRQGHTKDYALQLAKQQLIRHQNENVQVHPFYWSALIAIGDVRSMNVSSSSNWFYYLLIPFFSITLLFYFKKSKT